MTGGQRGSRIGILGGTLDPIHVGHIETALAARHALGLSSLIVMPSRIPPHRQQGPSASAFHRFAMAALAVNGTHDVTVSDEELRAEGPSFTALTLERLNARGIDSSRLFFIAGADAFAEIETWHRYPEVFDLANFVVVARPGVATGALADRNSQIRARLRDVEDRANTLERTSIYLVDARTPDVSSTAIRRRLRAGESITGLVAESVEAHIRQHQLYVDDPHADHLR